MGNKKALIIGVEKYQDQSIPQVDFAEADAKGIADALSIHSYSDNTEILLSDKATKATIESRLRRICSFLSPEDEFVFFYAGHGFSETDHNYITGSDTQLGDLTSTSILLQDIFREIRMTGCQHVILFLDSCHSGIEIDSSMRGIRADMSEAEFRDFFRDSEYQVGFASCKSNEKSYSSGRLLHGIWSYHIIQALHGDAIDALDKGNLLTANSLQFYLSAEIPRTIRDTLTTPKKQTPSFFGCLTKDFIVADLDPIISAKTAETKIAFDQPDRIIFSGYDAGSVKSLSGFKKGHWVPKNVDSAAESYIARAASDDIKKEAERIFQAAKKAFGYERRDIKVDLDVGMATVNCKDFEVGISISQNPDKASEYIITIDVWRFKSTELVLSHEFNEVFANTFNSIVFEYRSNIDIVKLIDAIEARKEKNIEIKYPTNYAYCTLNVQGLNERIEVEPRRFSIVSYSILEPRELVNRLLEAQRLLVGYRKILQLPSPQ